MIYFGGVVKGSVIRHFLLAAASLQDGLNAGQHRGSVVTRPKP